jgi:Mg-chelatase subunit ChlD
MTTTTTDLTQPDLSSTAFRSQQVIIVVDCSGSMKPHWSHFKGQYLLPAIQ